MASPQTAENRPDPGTGSRLTVTTSRFWRMLPAGMRRRWWLFRPFDLVARHWPVFGAKRGLLVVRMDGIGDMVLFRGALDHYADVFGVARSDITVVGCRSWASVAVHVFADYRVIAIDEHAFARRPWYRFRVALKVRCLNAKIAVCDSYFRRALMADSLVWLSGARRSVVGLPYISEKTRPEYRYYLSQATEIVTTGDYPTHEIVRHFRFLSALAGRALTPTPPKIAWREQRPPLPPGSPYVVFNPGANEPGRRWPLANYLSLARRLLAKGYRIVFIGHAAERTGLDAIAEFAREPGVIDLSGRTALPELMDLLKSAALVVTNDSGPAHLSIALGAPTVVVVGGGHFGCFVPYPPELTPATARFAYHVMECYHCFWRCHKRTDDRETFPCVAAVPEEQVWAEAQDLLMRAGARVVGTARP